MRSVRRLLLVLAAALVACHKNDALESSDASELIHSNGLKIAVPRSFSHKQTARGFSLVEGGDLRSPRRIDITVVDPPPDASVPGRTMRELGAGSGGVEHELSATRATQGRWVQLTARAQSEHGEPSFGWALGVLDSARIDTAD